MTPEQYARRVANERAVGLARVSVLLDDLCARWGLDPVQVWRLPREYEQQARRDLVAWRAQMMAFPVITREEAYRLIGINPA